MVWTLTFYQTPRGERPAAAFVEQLPDPARAEVAALLAALRNRGTLLRPPHSKSLGEGLFELRSVKHSVRVFYMFLPGRQIVLLDGIVKKRDDVPAAVLRRIRALQSEVLLARREGGR
jgi:phage-related protein